MMDRTDDTRLQLEAEIERQRTATAEARSRLDRLYDAIEAGVAELQDSRSKDRVDLAKLQIREGDTALEALGQRVARRPNSPRPWSSAFPPGYGAGSAMLILRSAVRGCTCSSARS